MGAMNDTRKGVATHTTGDGHSRSQVSFRERLDDACRPWQLSLVVLSEVDVIWITNITIMPVVLLRVLKHFERSL